MMRGETRGMKGRVLSLVCRAGNGVIGKVPLTLMLLGLVLAGSLPLPNEMALAQDPALEVARSTVQMVNNQLGWGAALQTRAEGNGFWVENVVREVPGQPGEPAVAGVALVGIHASNAQAVQDAREWTDQFDSILSGTYYGYEALLYSMDSPPMSGLSWFCGRIWLDAFVLRPSEFPHSREQIVEALHQAALANGLYNYCEPPGVTTPTPTSTSTPITPTSTATPVVPTSTATPVTPAATLSPTPGTPTPTATPVTPTVTPAIGPRWTPAPTKAPTPAPTPTEAWASACASGETNIGDASIFRRAKFTIGGTEPREVRITSPAENFAIVKEYGGLVYQKIDGQGWGTLTLEPGSYILSCSGSGYLGLMRATVCIQYPVVAEGPTGPEGEFPEVEHPPQPPEVPPGDIAKPSLPLGRIERIIVRPSIVRPSDNLVAEALVMEIGTEKRFTAWGVDDAWREGADDHIKNVTVDDWEVSDGDESIGSIDQQGLFKAKAEGRVTIKATAEKMTGVFWIEVMEQPPIIFEGWVHFFDESGGRVKPFADVPVEVWGWTKSISVCDGDPIWDVRTDPTGRFRFVLPGTIVLPWGLCEVYTKDVDSWAFHVSSEARAPTGYDWSRDPYEVGFQGPGKPGETLRLAQALGMKLRKLPEREFDLEGHVTHDGLPVEGATVWLLHNGRVVETEITDDSGIAAFSVRGLEGGRYRITAKCKPDRRGGRFDCTPPGRPGGHVTLHDWLINRRDIWVDLPITEPKTIDIQMISWADKIGYVPP